MNFYFYRSDAYDHIRRRSQGRRIQDRGLQGSTKELVKNLPYELTTAQKRALNEMAKDMASGKVMNRLVQGDVGSGKTILAVILLLMCAKAGYQGVLMAPTEVLAAQHYESFTELFRIL